MRAAPAQVRTQQAAPNVKTYRPPVNAQSQPPTPQRRTLPPAQMRTQPPAQVRTAPPPPAGRVQQAPPVRAQAPREPAIRYPAAQGKTYQAPGGATVHRDMAGAVREVHTPSGAVITHHPEGFRRVEAPRSGGRTVVADFGGHQGYVQRPMAFRGQDFVQRTYFSHGHTYAQIYRPYRYGGAIFDVYTPYRYYRPGFYAWAYQPWRTGFYYSWGWMGSPWYAYYGWYFRPYAVYPSPIFWLTDYLMALTLEDAYQARLDAALAVSPYAPGEVSLTPAVKQEIANQVQQQLEQEGADAQRTMGNGAPLYGATPPIFASNGPSVFVVSSPLNVYMSGGGECAITEGDVLRLVRRPAPSAYDTQLVVLASKGPDCACGSTVSVRLEDLQEMDNQMRARVDQGLADLQSHQGQGGLPALPSSAAGAALNTPFAPMVRPDADVAAQIGSVAQEATQAEQFVPGSAPQAAEPAVVRLGQTTDEVVAVLGTPLKIVDLGAKQIYIYPDMKITFLDGRVTDVQ